MAGLPCYLASDCAAHADCSQKNGSGWIWKKIHNLLLVKHYGIRQNVTRGSGCLLEFQHAGLIEAPVLSERVGPAVPFLAFATEYTQIEGDFQLSWTAPGSGVEV